jgi:N-acetyl-anhydromuramyl-L-alanine amidase AmpD
MIVPASLDAIKYVQAANWTHLAAPPRKKWIVIHAMEYPEKPDSAEWCARYFAGLEGPAPRASAHACIDSDSIVQCVPWEQIAWHAPGANSLGIGLEHAGYARQAIADWQDAYSRNMLELSAWLCAQLCRKFSIPPRFVDAVALKLGTPGITTHAQVTRAWRKSTHTDPGHAFPMGDYLARARHFAP